MAGLLSPCGFSSFPCLAQPSYAATGSQKREFQEDEPQRAGAYLASACNAFANLPYGHTRSQFKDLNTRVPGSLGAICRSSSILVSKSIERVGQGCM